MKKRSLTLIEVMIALGIASILLAVMFPYLRETMQIKKRVEAAKSFVFSKAHVQSRLATLFSKTLPSATFKTIQEKNQPLKLEFEFDNGYDYDEHFRGLLTGYLYFADGKLILDIQNKKDESHMEILFEGLKQVDFTFTYAEAGTFKEVKNLWEENGLPLFFILHITFVDNKTEDFYFRLHSSNRLETSQLS